MVEQATIPIRLKRTLKGRVWDVINEALKGNMPKNGSVNIELHLKEFQMRDMYITPRYKIDN
jgi:hypothetical protein